MDNTITVLDWGLIDYKKAWEHQQLIFNQLIEKKLLNDTSSDGKNYLILCEHPHVYTLGRNGKANNLLINPEKMKQLEATYYHIDRGGDITYHGPGQLVGYPILDLEALKLSLKEYIFRIEECVIQTLQHYNIAASRLKGATGVWLDAETNTARKICAIGVRASHYVTMHGFALNVNTNLDYFKHINPCGFVDKGVTSIKKELGQEISIEEVKGILTDKFKEIILG